MARKEHIVSYTRKQLEELVKKEGSRSDWEAASRKTEAELEAAIASDPDEAGMIVDWSKATFEMPRPKAVLNMRIDQDLLDYFRNTGKGYQTLINAVLRSYVEQKTHGRHKD